MVYQNLDSTKLDNRQLSYRFDLEKDVAWDRISEPGLHVPEDLLADFGVDISKVGPHIKTQFQWIYGLAVMETFIGFEKTILEFPKLMVVPPTISLTNLCDEELKHIGMFKRYAEHLRKEAPYWATHFPKYNKDSQEFLRIQRDFPGQTEAMQHYLCWLTVIFIEEFSVYFHSRLQGNIQPCWLSIHKAHRDEEIQHIVTDAMYLSHMEIAPGEKRIISSYFLMYLTNMFNHFTCTETAIQMNAAFKSHHQPAVEVVEARKTKFFDIILRSPSFKQTRKFCEPLMQLKDMLDVDS